ncbi:MAG TPA: lysylphosphatidylglycerol synthase transmembrane domain-containing protein [Candidatus Pacearchaeota archaeon]|nr:lysylphosphatidylglycerol synthase transmembrane domain-containing protein [Candidatus Pacearchaeota archaeon]
MKKKAILLICLAAGIGAFAYFVKTADFSQTWENILAMHWWQWAIILALHAGILAVGAARWKILLASMAPQAKYTDLLSAYFVSYGIAFFAPPMAIAGEFLKAYVIKDKYEMDYQKALSTVVLDKLLIGLLVVPTAAASFLYFFVKSKMILWFGLAVVFFLPVLAFMKIMKWNTGVTNIQRAEEGVVKKFVAKIKTVVEFLRGRKFFDEVAVLTLIEFSLALTHSWFMSWFLVGNQLKISQTFFVLGFSYLSNLFLVPGGLGSLEALQTFAFKNIVSRPEMSIGYAIIARTSEMTMAIIGVALLLAFYVDKAYKALADYDQS